MSLYDAAKDAVKLAQKVDNVELIQQLLEVQQQALDMQEKQQLLHSKISSLEKENDELKSIKRFVFASEHNYLVDPEDMTRKLCPVCTPKNRAATPVLSNGYCAQCKGSYR